MKNSQRLEDISYCLNRIRALLEERLPGTCKTCDGRGYYRVGVDASAYNVICPVCTAAAPDAREANDETAALLSDVMRWAAALDFLGGGGAAERDKFLRRYAALTAAPEESDDER